MAIWQGPREVFLEGIGFLAVIVGSVGFRASNNEFNGRSVNLYRCSVLLNDAMSVRQFYVHETLMRHNFVVFQTDTGHTFKVHLIADVYPGHHSPIEVDIDPTDWRPIGKYVGQCNKPAWYLKYFVLDAVQKFGTYEVGINDCRHFARAVAAFLAN